MADLLTRAALVMLAKTLHVKVEKVAHLESLGAPTLDAIRHRMADTIFDEHAEVFKRISALVPIVPLKIAIPIVQATVPAAAAGRAAGAIGLAHPKKASQTLTLVKVDYAADAAPYIDPRAVAKLAPLIDPESVVDIAREVLHRKDYITAAQFVEAATPDLIRAVERGIDDDEGLIRAGAYVHKGEVISYILRVIVESNPSRVSRVVKTTAEGPTDLRLAALSVMYRVDHDIIATVAEVMFAETDPAVLGDLVRSYVDEGAAPELLTFAASFTSGTLDKLAANPVIGDDRILSAVIDAATVVRDGDVWRAALDIAGRTRPETQHRAVELIAELDAAQIATVPGLLTEVGLWPELIELAARQDPELQVRIARAFRGVLTDADRTAVGAALDGVEPPESVLPLREALFEPDR